MNARNSNTTNSNNMIAQGLSEWTDEMEHLNALIEGIWVNVTRWGCVIKAPNVAKFGADAPRDAYVNGWQELRHIPWITWEDPRINEILSELARESEEECLRARRDVEEWCR